MKHMPSDEMKPFFASIQLKHHPREYLIVSLPTDDKEKALEFFKPLRPFSSITVDADEVSLIIGVDDWEKLKTHFKKYLVEGPYSAITFDVVLDLSLVGFLSVVSSILADSGISIYAISTYLRDHILVKSEDVDEAIKLLKELIQRCKSTN